MHLHPGVLLLIGLLFLGNLLVWGPEGVAVPLFFAQNHLSSMDLGEVMAVAGLGELIGLGVLRRFTFERWIPLTLGLAFTFHASVFLLLGLMAPKSTLIWGLCALLSNAFLAPFSPLVGAFLSEQCRTPSERARALMFTSAAGNLGEPLGAAAAGMRRITPALLLMVMGSAGVTVGLIVSVLSWPLTSAKGDPSQPEQGAA